MDAKGPVPLGKSDSKPLNIKLRGIMILKRVASNSDGTFGVLIDMGVAFALTIENPWLNNKRNVSCIPDGIYECKRVESPRFGNTFEIKDVPGRTHILFHTGNTEDDTEGCIIVGEQFEYLGDKAAVLSSRKGFGEFRRRTADVGSFTLNLVTV